MTKTEDKISAKPGATRRDFLRSLVGAADTAVVVNSVRSAEAATVPLFALQVVKGAKRTFSSFCYKITDFPDPVAEGKYLAQKIGGKPVLRKCWPACCIRRPVHNLALGERTNCELVAAVCPVGSVIFALALKHVELSAGRARSSITFIGPSGYGTKGVKCGNESNCIPGHVLWLKRNARPER